MVTLRQIEGQLVREKNLAQVCKEAGSPSRVVARAWKDHSDRIRPVGPGLSATSARHKACCRSGTFGDLVLEDC